MNLSLTEQLSYSTVRIECALCSGGTSTGTGFFFRFKDTPQGHIPVVITNKHVISDATSGTIIFTTANDQGEPVDTKHFKLYVDGFEKLWRKHPDPTVDLCAMPIAPFATAAKDRGVNLFQIGLDMSLIPSDAQLAALSALEDIVMIGYPNGIWDQVNNKPIFRKGVTATHPGYDYNGKREFMIDAACFPGSSGSPVFLLNENGYQDKKGNTYLGRKRIYLLGVLYAGPQHTVTGEVMIVDIPVAQKPVTIATIPNNLGIVVKSQRIRELEQLF